MVISANIPLPEFIDWLASLGSHLVIEFVTKEDAMVKKLLRNKADIYHDYTVENFEHHLGRHFETLRQQTYHGETRRLYFARPLTKT
jgi:16S rRNA C1402 N4-methylase RsmH